MSLPFLKLGLGAGGIKGILHIGALMELQKHQSLVFPKGVYGASIGSIIATYIAFGLPVNDDIVVLMKKYLSFNKIIPKLTFKDVSSIFAEKGMFPMTMFEKCVTDMFLEAGLDIRNKTLGDAQMPLYIVASNVTTGTPCIFSRNVSVLDALRCSCCIPGVFKPQELYGKLYVDGELLSPCLGPIVGNGLTFSLSNASDIRMYPKNMNTINPLHYMRNLYRMSMHQLHEHQKTDLTLCLKYPNLNSDSDLEDMDLRPILESSGKQLDNFLRTKGFC
jgi:hypothetical protein